MKTLVKIIAGIVGLYLVLCWGPVSWPRQCSRAPRFRPRVVAGFRSSRESQRGRGRFRPGGVVLLPAGDHHSELFHQQP